MSVREAIRKHPALVIAASFASVAITAGIAFYQSAGATTYSKINAWYSADDGATFFGGEAAKTWDLQSQSPPVYPATVYAAPDGKRFVAYLTRVPPAHLGELMSRTAEINNKRRTLSPTDPSLIPAEEQYRKLTMGISSETEIKRPGHDEHWQLLNGPEGAAILSNIHSPTGSGDGVPVMP